MIDKWDIELFEKWLKLAKEKGTDVIKVRLDERDQGLVEGGFLSYRVLVKNKYTL